MTFKFISKFEEGKIIETKSRSWQPGSETGSGDGLQAGTMELCGVKEVFLEEG